jgi:hypothetical protein
MRGLHEFVARSWLHSSRARVSRLGCSMRVNCPGGSLGGRASSVSVSEGVSVRKAQRWSSGLAYASQQAGLPCRRVVLGSGPWHGRCGSAGAREWSSFRGLGGVQSASLSTSATSATSTAGSSRRNVETATPTAAVALPPQPPKEDEEGNTSPKPGDAAVGSRRLPSAFELRRLVDLAHGESRNIALALGNAPPVCPLGTCLRMVSVDQHCTVACKVYSIRVELWK